MLELSFFQNIDTYLLVTANGANSPELDILMWLISSRWIWVPLYILLAGMLIYRYGWLKGSLYIVMAAVIITLTDQTCASVIRPLVARLRPSNPDNPISVLLHIVNGYRGGKYGFPSCHAANTCALAAFLSLLFRKRYITIALAIWSLLVSYSRIYLGVHYPSDILGGFIVGSLYSLMMYKSAKWMVYKRQAVLRAFSVLKQKLEQVVRM